VECKYLNVYPGRGVGQVNIMLLQKSQIDEETHAVVDLMNTQIE
jgi:hypothetical protein